MINQAILNSEKTKNNPVEKSLSNINPSTTTATNAETCHSEPISIKIQQPTASGSNPQHKHFHINSLSYTMACQFRSPLSKTLATRTATFKISKYMKMHGQIKLGVPKDRTCLENHELYYPYPQGYQDKEIRYRIQHNSNQHHYAELKSTACTASTSQDAATKDLPEQYYIRPARTTIIEGI